MSGHAIKGGRVVCLEPETGQCRAEWDWNACGCEFYGETVQNPDGSWSHWAYSYDLDDDVEHRSVTVTSATNCNICNWLNDDITSYGPDETWAAGRYNTDLELPDGPIVETWEGDYYTWDYSESTPEIGRFIGRLVIALWADDQGLAA
jgi:hypothetical protein